MSGEQRDSMVLIYRFLMAMSFRNQQDVSVADFEEVPTGLDPGGLRECIPDRTVAKWRPKYLCATNSYLIFLGAKVRRKLLNMQQLETNSSFGNRGFRGIFR
jgi:hypothetical protein